MKSSDKEILQGTIGGIKVSGFASITYWSIMLTDKNIHFLQHGTNYLPGIYGVLSDIHYSQKSKKSSESIENILGSTQKYFTVPIKDVSDYVDINRTLLGLKLSFEADSGKKVSIKLAGKKAYIFESITGLSVN